MGNPARALGLLALLALGLGACLGPSREPVTLEPGEQGVAVLVGGRPFTEFLNASGAKPVFHPVRSAEGVPVTRGFPLAPREGEAHDHPHHVSLWFAHGDVDGHDFWHGELGTAWIETESTWIVEDELHSVHLWRTAHEIVAEEHRVVSFGGTAETRWIDFDLRLRPRNGSISFRDTKEGTLALRIASTLRAEGEVAAGELIDSEGRTGRDVWGQRARWIAALGPVEETVVTVALLDHPQNPRHPTWWHARTYGLLAANPFGRQAFEGESAPKGDLLVEEELRLRYRVWIANGLRSEKQIESAWSAYERQR